VLVVSALLGSVLLGCQDGRRADARVNADQSVLRSVEPSAERQSNASPPNEYRRRLTQEALRGLTYDSGRVEIDEAAAAELVAGLDVSEAEAEHNRAVEALAQNRVLEAISANTRAVLLAPAEPRYYEELGYALLAKRMSDKAAAAFRSALDRDAGAIRARLGLGFALQRLGDLDGSIETLEQVVAQTPDDTHARSRLAISYYYAERDVDAWRHVHAVEARGAQVPPQFRALLAARTPETSGS